MGIGNNKYKLRTLYTIYVHCSVTGGLSKSDRAIINDYEYRLFQLKLDLRTVEVDHSQIKYHFLYGN